MKMTLTHRTFFFLFIIGMMSCNSLNSVVKEKGNGGGTTKIYTIGMDDAWKISKKVFRWAGTDAIEEYRDEGYMLTTSGMNWVSSGAVMGAWLEEMGTDKIKVTVISKRRIATNIATTMTETKYHKLFNKAVEIVSNGEKLPLESPL